MDTNDIPAPQPPSPKTGRNHDGFWNVLTLFILLGAVIIVVLVAAVYSNPASSLNPLPRPTLIPTLFIPTAAIPPTLVVPTSTTAPTKEATAVQKPTEIPTTTPTAIQATPVGKATLVSPTPTQRASSLYSFALQAAPRFIDGSLFNPGRGCKWLGVAGQVFDLKNSPVALGIIIQVGGVIDGKPISIASLTGTATQYGPAGYEVTLNDQPVSSKGQIWIRLLDQAGIAISDRVTFDTSADCAQNLVMINFKQVK